jgi:hypothetical protein
LARLAEGADRDHHLAEAERLLVETGPVGACGGSVLSENR